MIRDSETIHILHVDDDVGFAEMVAPYLEREDSRFTVESVFNTSDVIDYVNTHTVDCIVSDYDMPGQNGIELLETIRNQYPDLPFILYTGKGSEEIASEAISAGVTDYLQKETGTSQYAVLANRIANAVEAARSVSEAERRQHRLEQILKTVPGCVVQLDTDGQFIYANQRAEDVLGLETSEVTQRAYDDPEWDIRDLEGEPIPEERLPFARVQETGEPLYGVKHSIKWPEGKRKVLLVNGAPLFDGQGEIDSIVFSLTDITEEQDRQRELERTRRRLTLATEATNTGIWEWNIETDEVVWSETLQQALGFEVGEFEGTFDAFADRIHPDDITRVQEQIERAIETDSMYQAEFRMLCTDGSVQWVATRGQLVQTGGANRMVGIHHDITDRKEHERELQETVLQLKGLVDSIEAAVWMKDSEGRYLLVNQQWREVFNMDDEAQVIGKTPEDLFPGPLAKQLQASDRQVIATGEPTNFEEELTLDQETRTYLARTTPVYDEDGDLYATCGIASDITDRKEREKQLKVKTERLEEFASVVSHDLRSPLSTASGYLELAREDGKAEHFDRVEGNLARMDRIIENVLWLAQEGREIRATEKIDVEREIRDACEVVIGDNTRTELSCTEDSLRVIRADRDRLRQLLENIIRNTVEHAGPDVTIRAEPIQAGFAISDDGPGIPTAIRDQVFERGYSTENENTGLGLAIVKQIAEAHGWNIELTESASGGARFEFTDVEFAEEQP